jgi:ribosomal protein L11 methylase PrmA
MIGFDPASFRDPSGRLFRHAGAIFRTCSPVALDTFRHAQDTGLLGELERQGLIVPSELKPSKTEGLDATQVGDWIVRQPELPLVTYSYEWSFSMLRDAALVTLRALDICLAHGFVLKDATAFNVLFEGSTPRLIDVHSLEPRQEGALWAGYAQFCRSFLFPLFFMSYKGLDPRPSLLAGLGEISVNEAARVFGWRDRLKAGVLVNVVMQAQLERRFAARAEEVSKAGSTLKYPVVAVRRQVNKLRKVIEGLALPQGDHWTTYTDTHTYGDADVQAKEAFVARVLQVSHPPTVLDLGTNTGQYARLARANGARVVAVDVSPGCVDAVYRRAQGDTSLSPLVADLTKPTPAVGWRLIERKGLLDRLRGDSLLALALIHHLRITGGIPLSEIMDLLTRLAPSGIIEWVGRGDNMVRQMLALRPDVYEDYTSENFERELSARASINARESLKDADRTLYAYERASTV